MSFEILGMDINYAIACISIQFNSFIVLTATGPYTYIHIITNICILYKHINIIVYAGINNETFVYE